MARFITKSFHNPHNPRDRRTFVLMPWGHFHADAWHVNELCESGSGDDWNIYKEGVGDTYDTHADAKAVFDAHDGSNIKWSVPAPA